MVDSFTIKPGQSLGRYEILSLIARGGMAEVWLARFNGVGGFQKQVVLKTILPHLAEDPEFVRMFINEALLAARLNHPNVVQIFDLGRLEGRYFIAMEHVPGRSFRQISRRRREQGELIPTWFTLRVIAAVCDGLYYAHEYCDEQGNPLGLVHRDVSPENVMVSFTGITKILDFGVAKATTASTVTKAGTLKGKYSYISPEQVRGAPADRRSDIYAIGVILYEFLTGVRPFRGNNDLALLREIARGNPTSPRKIAPWISEELEHIVLTSLAINPDDRYDDAGKLGMDILEFLRKSGDQVSQRDIGLYVSSLFPEEPSIPSDVMKRLVSAQSVETQLKTPEPNVVANDPAAIEPEIIEAEELFKKKDSGTIEITGLDTWQGDDIPPENHPRGAKPKLKAKARSASGSFVSVDESASPPEKPAAKQVKPAPAIRPKAVGGMKSKQLSSAEDQDTTQPRGSGGGLGEPKEKPAAPGAQPAAQKPAESAPPQSAEGAAKGAADAAKPQAKPTDLSKPSEKKGRGSWLQRIIRREAPMSPAEGKEEAGAPSPEGGAAPKLARDAELDLRPEPLDRVKTEESEVEFEFEQFPADGITPEGAAAGKSKPSPKPVTLRPGVTGSVARPKTVGKPPPPEPAAKSAPKPKGKTQQGVGATPKPATESKVSSPALPKPSTASKKPSVAVKPVVAPPLARPKTAEHSVVSASLPKPQPAKAGSSPSQPKPSASSPKPQPAKAGSSPSLPKPSASLPKPQPTKAGSSPSLPKPSTAKSAAASLPNPSPGKESTSASSTLPAAQKSAAPAGGSPLPKPQTAKSGSSPSLPKPSTGTSGSSPALPRPSTKAGGDSAALPKPQTGKGGSSSSLPQPSTAKSSGVLAKPSTPAKPAPLAKPRTERSVVSSVLPQPSSLAKSAKENAKPAEEENPAAANTAPEGASSRRRSIFDAPAQVAEKRSNQVANWFNRPPSEEAEEQPEKETKGAKAAAADWFTRRPLEETEAEDKSRDHRSQMRRPAEADLPSPAGISTRPGGWDSAARGPADFFGMKRPVYANDDADVFTSHGTPRGWNPDQTFGDHKSNVSKKTEEDMITRFREMGRQARSLASHAGQSRAEDVETRRGFSSGNDGSLAVELAAVHFERGLSNLRRGDYNGALREWEEAISQDPENRVYQSNMKRLKDLIASL